MLGSVGGSKTSTHSPISSHYWLSTNATVPDEKTSSYQKVITHLRENNSNIKVLGWPRRLIVLVWGGFIITHVAKFALGRATFFQRLYFRTATRYLLDRRLSHTSTHDRRAQVLSYDSQLGQCDRFDIKKPNLAWWSCQSKRATRRLSTKSLKSVQRQTRHHRYSLRLPDTQ